MPLTYIEQRMDPNGLADYGVPNTPMALVIHTAEEPADDYEGTPAWFQNPAANAGTQYYFDNDGDAYKMCEDHETPKACGTDASNRTWKGQRGIYPPWGGPGISNNCRTLNAELEGFAGSIGQTLSEPQYQTLLEWIREKSAEYNIPLDRDHIVGHFELSSDRGDPGVTFPWDRLMADLGRPTIPQPVGPYAELKYLGYSADQMFEWAFNMETPVEQAPYLETVYVGIVEGQKRWLLRMSPNYPI